MTRRFEVGPILVAAGSLLLVVSLFLDWYGAGISAWDAFELVDLLLAALAIAALVGVVGTFAPDLGYVDRRWLPWLAAAAVVLVAASIIDPPPAAAGRDPHTGAWIALAAAVVALGGAILSVGRVSFSVAVEGRETRQRVPAVDERQQTAETAAVMGNRRERVAARRAGAAAAPTEPEQAPIGTDEG